MMPSFWNSAKTLLKSAEETTTFAAHLFFFSLDLLKPLRRSNPRQGARQSDSEQGNQDGADLNAWCRRIFSRFLCVFGFRCMAT